MTSLRARAAHPLAPAVLAAILFAAALRPGPFGLATIPAAALLAQALAAAPTRRPAAFATFLAALGPGTVAALPLAPVAPTAALPVAVAYAATFALAGAAAGPARPGAPLGPARAGRFLATWLALEGLASLEVGTLMGHPGASLPYLTLGAGVADTPWRGVGALGGPRATTLVVLGGGVGLTALARAARARRPRGAAAAAGLVVALAAAPLATSALAHPVAPPDADVLAVRLVQHAPREAELAAARFDAALARAHATALRRATLAPDPHAGDGPTDRLVVWPEGVLPRPVEDLDVPPALLPSGVDVVFGAGRDVPGGVANAGLLWRDGTLTVLADKRRTVPFAEADLVRGDRRPPTRIHGARVAVLSCWEVAFPEAAREAARDGADAILVLANDAYAAGGPVTELHLRQARLRAAEVGLPVVFVQATGPSGAFDAAGGAIVRLPAGVPAHADADVPLDGRLTPFRATGDGPWTASLVALVGGLVARRPKGGEA
ncbi:MAG: nitrilase-related carbon-nitrogen hydrolase [Trueperaceae bacterium]|nr:nitrilase-related carbon-nitrogen hydrolase [Trueperaceae bacterium]